MTPARPLFFSLLIVVLVGCGTTAGAADDTAQPQASGSFLHNQALDLTVLWQLPVSQSAFSDLFFLRTRTRLDLRSPGGHPRSAVLNSPGCYTMRMYKVKRQEHFAAGESASRGYSTCELASNYQMRSAVAHAQPLQSRDSTNKEPNK